MNTAMLLLLPLGDAYRGETHGLSADQEEAIKDLALGVQQLTAAAATLASGEDPATAAELLTARLEDAGLLRDVASPGDALRFVRNRLGEQRHLALLQNIPLRSDGSLGDISNRRVHYDSPAEQRATSIRVHDGLLHRDDGVLLDTTQGSTFFAGQGSEMFVLDATGVLHVAPHRIGEYQHSSLVAGADVAMSGEIRATAGRIIALTDRSGHYRPDAVHMRQLLELLDRRGVDLDFPLRLGWGMSRSVDARALLGEAASAASPPEGETLSLFPQLVEHAMRLPGGWPELGELLGRHGWRLGPGPGVTDGKTGCPVESESVLAVLREHGAAGAR